jgi:hypothetical protein
MALTVSSMLITVPRFTPRDSALLKARTSSLFFSFFLPTMETIFVVPISMAATDLFFFVHNIYLFVQTT